MSLIGVRRNTEAKTGSELPSAVEYISLEDNYLFGLRGKKAERSKQTLRTGLHLITKVDG